MNMYMFLMFASKVFFYLIFLLDKGIAETSLYYTSILFNVRTQYREGKRFSIFI